MGFIYVILSASLRGADWITLPKRGGVRITVDYAFFDPKNSLLLSTVRVCVCEVGGCWWVGCEGCGVGWVSVGWVLREWVGCGGQGKGCFGFSPKLNYRGTKGLL